MKSGSTKIYKEDKEKGLDDVPGKIDQDGPIQRKERIKSNLLGK